MPTNLAPDAPKATTPVVASAPRRRRGMKGKLIAVAVLLTPIVGFAVYTWSALTLSFSTGERAGYMQKLSNKGWLCKTWEGELAMVSMPGAAPEIFNFSVRDEVVAKKLNDMAGQRVSVAYEQHKGVPTSCFGETEYFVTGVRQVQ